MSNGLKTLVVALVLAAPMFAPAQESTTFAIEASGNGSPVVLSGTVTATDNGSGRLPYSLEKHFFVTNTSSRNIVLMITEINVTGMTKIDQHETRVDEYFFAAEVFEPGTTRMIDESFGPFGVTSDKVDSQPEEPGAVARIVFVQFADGTTWGDVATQYVMHDRVLTCKELELLADTYRRQGEQSFIARLLESSELPGISNLQQLYLADKNADSVIKKIGGMLRYADLHQRAMELQHSP
jgi:hypothetical protein